MNNYEILGLYRGASKEDIKKAYRKLVMHHHPDKGGSQIVFLKIKQAYDELIEGKTGEQAYRYTPPQEKRSGSISIIDGILTKEGDFLFTFRFTDVWKIIAGGEIEGIYWGDWEKGKVSRSIQITKEQLKKCNYIITLNFIDHYGNSLEKTWKIKKPPTVKDKIINFFKGKK